jgi:hypothetical protein
MRCGRRLQPERRDTDPMKATDHDRLSQPYPEGADPPENGGAAALGMELPHWTALCQEILNDFADRPPYGIGWWAPAPGASRRILISDQLYACAISVADNLLEAALHWLEFQEASEQDSGRFAEVVQMTGGTLALSPPRPRSPLEQLRADLVRIHRVGIVRALASALDCLAGVIIGVAALPINILRAGFGQARSTLGKVSCDRSNGARLQAEFATHLEANIAAAGPPGWLDWTLDYRNMVVHRGRRTEHGQYLRRKPILHGPDGQKLLRADRVSQLPRDPGTSDIEVFVDDPSTFVLPEDEKQTLDGLRGSTKKLIEATAQPLLKLWRWRRDHPSLLFLKFLYIC